MFKVRDLLSDMQVEELREKKRRAVNGMDDFWTGQGTELGQINWRASITTADYLSPPPPNSCIHLHRSRVDCLGCSA